MQPHRHHRSAASLSCVPAAWTSLLAPVLPPETEETVIPAGRRRTGLGRAGRHFSACPAGYQPAPKSADPLTCTGRQCTHRDDQNSHDRPKQRPETAKRSSGGQDTKQRPQRLTRERNQSQARQSRPASPRTPLLLRSLPQATGPSGSPQWCRPQADPPAPARRQPVREPARDNPQNSRPPTPRPQPQSSTNTANLYCCCIRPTSDTH